MLLVLLLACETTTPRAPRLVVDADVLDFGEVPLAEEGRLALGLRNRGRAPLDVDVLGPQLTSAMFEPQVWTLSLAPGDSAELPVVYRPEVEGEAADQLLFATNDPDWPVVSVPLLGLGVPERFAEIALDPDRLDFGEVAIGEVARAPVAVSNAGDAPLTLAGWDLRGSTAFTLAEDPSGWVLAPGGSRELTVVFTPLGSSPEESYEGDWGNLVLLSDARTQPEAVVFLEGNR